MPKKYVKLRKITSRLFSNGCKWAFHTCKTRVGKRKGVASLGYSFSMRQLPARELGEGNRAGTSQVQFGKRRLVLEAADEGGDNQRVELCACVSLQFLYGPFMS